MGSNRFILEMIHPPATVAPMAEMPLSSDPLPGFFVAPSRCFRLIYSPQLQSNHWGAPVKWRGRYMDARARTHVDVAKWTSSAGLHPVAPPIGQGSLS
jgi:hypothetical protein